MFIQMVTPLIMQTAKPYSMLGHSGLRLSDVPVQLWKGCTDRQGAVCMHHGETAAKQTSFTLADSRGCRQTQTPTFYTGTGGPETARTNPDDILKQQDRPRTEHSY